MNVQVRLNRSRTSLRNGRRSAPARRQGSRPDAGRADAPRSDAGRADAGRAKAEARLRRAREAAEPQDEALYRCRCGFVFSAQVSTSVRCPHCDGVQAW
jgi:rubrerythrin